MYTLIFVLWLVAVISVLSFVTGATSQRSYSIVRSSFASITNYLLQRDLLETTFHLLSKDPWLKSIKIETEEGTFSIEISDEGSSLNPNSLKPEDLKFLLSNCGVDTGEQMDVMIDSFLDWVDEDNFRRLNGAEKDYYEALTPPYAPRNGKILSKEELLFIRGFDVKTYNCLSPVLSVYGKNKINIGTASLEALTALGFSKEDAEKIISARKTRLINNIKELADIVSYIPTYAEKWLGFSPSGVYRIKIKTEDGGTNTFIVDLGRKKVLRFL